MAEVVVHQQDEDDVRIIEITLGCLAFRGPRDGRGETCGALLLKSVQDWRWNHRSVRIVAMTPFVLNGNTVGYDLWYEPWIAPMTLEGSITTVTYDCRSRD